MSKFLWNVLKISGGTNAPNATPGCAPVSDYSTANAFLLFTPHMTVLNKVVQPNYHRT